MGYMKARPSENERIRAREYMADGIIPEPKGKLNDKQKARVLAVLQAIFEFNPDQAALYARLFKAGNNPAELERIYQEA